MFALRISIIEILKANKFAVHTSSGRLFHKWTTVTKTMFEETTGHNSDLHNAESNIIVINDINIIVVWQTNLLCIHPLEDCSIRGPL